MAVTSFTYTSSNTDQQYLDSFDLGYVSSIEYKIEQSTNTYTQYTTVTVTHNGANTFDTQHGITTTGSPPTLITTDVIDYSGKVTTTPPDAITKYNIIRDTVSTVLYGENLPAGYWLQDYTNGFVLDRISTPNAICIRDATAVRSKYCAPNTYFTDPSIVPVASDTELLSSTWVSQNDSLFTQTNTYISATSSGQVGNYQYQQITVVPNRSYKAIITAQHIDPADVVVDELTDRSIGSSFITLGTALGETDLYGERVSTTETTYEIPFTTEANTVYLTFGNGIRNSICNVSSVSVQEYLPHYIFNNTSNSSILLVWEDVASNTSLFTISDHKDSKYYRVSVTSNTVEFTQFISNGNNVTASVGSQAVGTNKLLITYTDDEFEIFLNGVSTTVDRSLIPALTNITLDTAVDVYSYWPEIVDDIT